MKDLNDKKETHPKQQVVYKFILLCALLLGYFSYLSYQYNFVTGGIASALTWTFFVLCTPIADAGFLIDFPLRLLFGVRMLISEMVVWALAISINTISLLYFAEYYQTTVLTQLLHTILTVPFPYWGVILLSVAGTFLSIQFADELMDVLHHRDREFFHKHSFKHEIIIIVFFIFIIYGYYKLIASLGIENRF
ncbi:MAG: hypothetical protein COV66_01395 [Nitrospinae bacterium CG11_big_fil_rev_8_21_14_0_20_45_15]|nr:MAG: hypothetical protein COV66_01395 [Nitrospinae bacterium CG11_big_fil_rev_8_21_14_0_20_45_15]